MLCERFIREFFMPTNKKTNDRHPRGRPQKIDKDLYGQVTCVLRLDTIERLKDGADSKHFGEYLQHHLDRYPPPSRAQYLALTQGQTQYYTMFKRKRIPVLMAAGGLSKEAKKLAKERLRREKLSSEQRAWEDSLREGVTKIVREHYAGNRS